MTETQIYIHVVWTTKNRQPLLLNDTVNLICKHIREYAQTKEIKVINVNGFHDHLHCLLMLSKGQNIAMTTNLLKGESSYWAYRNLNLTEKFIWDDSYFAVSVSPTQLHSLVEYIEKNPVRHKHNDIIKEYEEFITPHENAC